MHPTEEILLGLASGECDLPRRVLVEGHLGGCATCRATLQEMTLAGGALLRGIDGGTPPPGLWDRLRQQVAALPGGPAAADALPEGAAGIAGGATAAHEAVTAGQAAPAGSMALTTPAPLASPPRLAEVAAMPLPPSLHGELPALAAVRRLNWRWALAPGAWYAELGRDPWTRSVLLLGWLAPRRALPAHRHLAQEDVLVLAGGFDDVAGHHEAGEYAIYPAGSEHRPVTEPGQDCWCLVRLEKPNQLLGWRGWLQRLGP
jgi:putative transcriptional regulator